MKKSLVDLARIGLVLACLTALAVAGCATSRGFGEDLQSLGRSIERGADRAAR